MFNQEALLASSFPYFLFFGHEHKLSASIWQDVMAITNLDSIQMALSMWTMNKFVILMCNAHGYEEFGNFFASRYILICHYSRKWISTSNL
jgi:hypothetical protein